MSTIPHLTTKNFKVWLAGHAAYRAQSKALFDQLSEGIAESTGNAENWRKLRDVVSRTIK